MNAVQAGLFAEAADFPSHLPSHLRPRLPPDLLYETEFVSRDEEAALLDEISRLPLAEAQYKAYTARRRILSFGSEYDFDRNRLHEGPPIPGFLLPLRDRVAARTGIAAERYSHALVTEYRPGTPLGWHRDVPEFEVVAGISLGTACRMRFRRYPHVKRPKGKAVTGNAPTEKPVDLVLEPRSLYVMQRESRWSWQHSVPPTPGLRHSITFRTRRASSSAPR